MTQVSYRNVRASILARIRAGEWALGERIPDEAALAGHYGCARTTVNRALRALAEEGLVQRRRKGGTRVTPMPVRQARFDIPVIREQVEAAGSVYRHRLLQRRLAPPPAEVRRRLGMAARQQALYVETLHLADARPYGFERRWINSHAIPAALDAPLDAISANEWLVRSVPFSAGELSFGAVNADAAVAAALGARPGDALFVLDRTTWTDGRFLTTVRLFYPPGHGFRTEFSA